MGTRPPQPPAKQFILRRTASDEELLELYFQQDDLAVRRATINQRVQELMRDAQESLKAVEKTEANLLEKISSAKKLVQVPVIAVMNPAKNEKTLFYPDDTALKNPIETVPMKPEDYELPLL